MFCCSAAENEFKRTNDELMKSLKDPESSQPKRKPIPVQSVNSIYELAARFSYLALLKDAVSSDEAFLMRLKLTTVLLDPYGEPKLQVV